MITQLLDRVSDIAQNQTDRAKHNIFRLCLGMLISATALVVFLLAVVALAAAIFVALCRVLPVDGACAVVGIIILFVAIFMACMARKISSGRCCHYNNRQL